MGNSPEKTGLSLRTVQRIENGESIPRGDTLKKLAIALQISPDEIIDWQIQEDVNVITLLNLSQVGFVLFPWLGIIIPMLIWINKKDKIKDVDIVGKAILNFQISWNLLLIGVIIFWLLFGPIGIIIWYIYSIVLIIINVWKYKRKGFVKYVPSLKILK